MSSARSERIHAYFHRLNSISAMNPLLFSAIGVCIPPLIMTEVGNATQTSALTEGLRRISAPQHQRRIYRKTPIREERWLHHHRQRTRLRCRPSNYCLRSVQTKRVSYFDRPAADPMRASEGLLRQLATLNDRMLAIPSLHTTLNVKEPADAIGDLKSLRSALSFKAARTLLAKEKPAVPRPLRARRNGKRKGGAQ